MITPNDIDNKKFSNSFRGFNKEEVDKFLDEISLTIEGLVSENNQLKKMVLDLRKEIETHKKNEASVLETIAQAKSLMSDISESAEKRAEVIIRNAHADGNRIIDEANESVADLKKKRENMILSMETFKHNYRSFLEEELARIDVAHDDLMVDLSEDFYPASMSNSDRTKIIDELDFTDPVIANGYFTEKSPVDIDDTIVISKDELAEISVGKDEFESQTEKENTVNEEIFEPQIREVENKETIVEAAVENVQQTDTPQTVPSLEELKGNIGTIELNSVLSNSLDIDAEIENIFGDKAEATESNMEETLINNTFESTDTPVLDHAVDFRNIDNEEGKSSEVLTEKKLDDLFSDTVTFEDLKEFDIIDGNENVADKNTTDGILTSLHTDKEVEEVPFDPSAKTVILNKDDMGWDS